MGVFLETLRSGESIKAGTVLAFYPGSVYAPSDMLAVYPHIYTDNSYLITRLDEVYFAFESFGIFDSLTTYSHADSHRCKPCGYVEQSLQDVLATRTQTAIIACNLKGTRTAEGGTHKGRSFGLPSAV